MRRNDLAGIIGLTIVLLLAAGAWMSMWALLQGMAHAIVWLLSL